MPITGVVTGGPETRYQVFRNNRQVTFYESQLQPLDSVNANDPLIELE